MQLRQCGLVMAAGAGLALAGCGEAGNEVDETTGSANDEVAIAQAGGAAGDADGDAEQEWDFYEDWSDGIDADKWLVAGWNEHDTQMSPERVFVDDDDKLNIIFINDSEEGFLGGALQTTKEDFGYGRWEARLKPTDVPGLLNSMYTIDWRDGEGTREEIDIEFLTYTFDHEYPGEMWIALHKADHESTDFSLPLDFNPSQDFHIFGWEITPEHIEYFIDGEPVYRYVYAENDITFEEPYMLKFNVWSNDGPWIQGPPEEDVEAVYQVDWVRFKSFEDE